MASLKELVELYVEMENTSSHKKIVGLLTSFFRSLDPDDVRTAAYLVLGTVGPEYEDTELGIREKLAIRSIADAFGISRQKVEKTYSDTGDLGDAAFEFSSNKNSDLTIRDVMDCLTQIKNTSGEGSQQKKIELLAEILARASAMEAKYIMRITLGELRLGFGEQFVLSALAMAFTGDDKNTVYLEEAYNVCTDIGQLAESVSEYGLASIKRFSVKIGRPVRSMLAKRVDKFENLNDKFPEQMAAEEKYDGERIQVHIINENIQIFSRRLDNITDQFPDVVDAVKKHIKAEKAVLDGEVIAFRNENINSFQELMQRRRKYDVEEYVDKVPVVAYMFDIIYLNGKSYLKVPYPHRRTALEEHLEENEKIRLVERTVSADFNEIRSFFDRCIDKGLEGIIIKSVADNSFYQPGKRGWLWVKWKKEYAEDVRDTFDLIIVGFYSGKGKRQGLFGSLLCAVLNKEKNQYETFTRVGTGFTDQDLEEISELLNKKKIKKNQPNLVVEKEMVPDSYIDPSVVIEVLGSQVTESPHHTAGKNKSDKGYALRFPRFLRMRYDKGPLDVTTIEEVRNLL